MQENWAMMDPTETPRSEACAMLDDMERILISEEALAQRVAELGAEISRDYDGRELVLIGILKGGIVFAADLMRSITLPVQLELVGASAYKGGTVPIGRLRVTKDVDVDLSGRHLLVIEDIYDSGHTLDVILDLLKLHRPASIECAALLHKRKPHLHPVDIKYIGFEIDDVFVVGYGLDYAERYRNLPCIGVLKQELIG